MLWGDLPDARTDPIEPSLDLLAALHKRWLSAWRRLAPSEWQRTFIHPLKRQHSVAGIERIAAQYAWHGRHHVAQIRSLRTRSGWLE